MSVGSEMNKMWTYAVGHCVTGKRREHWYTLQHLYVVEACCVNEVKSSHILSDPTYIKCSKGPNSSREKQISGGHRQGPGKY